MESPYILHFYQLEKLPFLAKKKLAGGPLTLEVLSGKNGLFVHLWAEQVKQQQHIFHSKIITKGPPGDIKVQPSQVSCNHYTILTSLSYIHIWFPMPGVQTACAVASGGSRTSW